MFVCIFMLPALLKLKREIFTFSLASVFYQFVIVKQDNSLSRMALPLGTVKRRAACATEGATNHSFIIYHCESHTKITWNYILYCQERVSDALVCQKFNRRCQRSSIHVGSSSAQQQILLSLNIFWSFERGYRDELHLPEGRKPSNNRESYRVNWMAFQVQNVTCSMLLRETRSEGQWKGLTRPAILH